MGIRTTYICDRCGAEQCTQTQLWNVRMSLDSLANPNNFSTTHPLQALWCRKCCKETGLFPVNEPTPKDPIPHPTQSTSEKLENIIREIVLETVQESKQ